MFRSVDLPNTIKGKLFLHSMPGRAESWDEFEQFAQIAKLELIVCLNSINEIQYYSPSYANAIATKSLPCFRIEYAIDDYESPNEKIKLLKLIQVIAKEIQEGYSILVHCNHGINRTGLFAHCILEQLGLDKDTAALLVFKAGSTPSSQTVIDAYL